MQIRAMADAEKAPTLQKGICLLSSISFTSAPF
jgi:hypothetical protein